MWNSSGSLLPLFLSLHRLPCYLVVVLVFLLDSYAGVIGGWRRKREGEVRRAVYKPLRLKTLFLIQFSCPIEDVYSYYTILFKVNYKFEILIRGEFFYLQISSKSF